MTYLVLGFSLETANKTFAEIKLFLAKGLKFYSIHWYRKNLKSCRFPACFLYIMYLSIRLSTFELLENNCQRNEFLFEGNFHISGNNLFTSQNF